MKSNIFHQFINDCNMSNVARDVCTFFARLACSNSLGYLNGFFALKVPISTEIPLLKDNFPLHSNTVHTFQEEICGDDTFKLFMKTLLKEVFTTGLEIATHWSPMRPKIECWRLDFQNWSPAGDSRFVR